MYDSYAYKRLFNLCMSYGGVGVLLLSIHPLQQLFSEPITAEALQSTGTALGGLLSVGMGLTAAAAGLVRKLLFRFGGVNRQSLLSIFLLGAFWHLPLSLLLRGSVPPEESETATRFVLYLTAAGLLASAVLCGTLYFTAPQQRRFRE